MNVEREDAKFIHHHFFILFRSIISSFVLVMEETSWKFLSVQVTFNINEVLMLEYHYIYRSHVTQECMFY